MQGGGLTQGRKGDHGAWCLWPLSKLVQTRPVNEWADIAKVQKRDCPMGEKCHCVDWLRIQYRAATRKR